jgi:hypothetical protein
MNAGLPTTGIGGTFYMISVLLMIFTEIILTLRGKSSRSRWKFVLGQSLLVFGIIASSWLTAYILIFFIPKKMSSEISSFSANTGLIHNGEKLFLLPFIILAFLLLLTQIFRAYLVIRNRIHHFSQFRA